VQNGKAPVNREFRGLAFSYFADQFRCGKTAGALISARKQLSTIFEPMLIADPKQGAVAI